MKETVLSFINKINEKRGQLTVTAVATATAIVILICLLFSGTTISYNVIYDGKVVAQIKDKSVYNMAMEGAAKVITSADESLLSEAEIKPVLSVEGDFNTEAELKEIILSNSDKVSKGYIVNVDGKQVLYLSDDKAVSSALEDRLNAYNQKDKSCSSDFSSNVTVTSAYFEKSLLNTQEQMSAYVDTLDVVTVVNDVESKKLSFDTVVKKSSSKKAGYTAVATKGVEGVKEISKQITYLNGEKTEETVVSEKVVSSPVNEVILVGTATASFGSSNKYLSSGKFLYPVDKSARTTVTSYWGDGRNHKAVDIAGPVGTRIFASVPGKVSYAGFRSDYGYNVIIDHGNGLQTRYAHCSKLFVKEGETVAAGQTIAFMGSTGDSTGPHLHFEVIINGTRVDPAPYIGLY